MLSDKNINKYLEVNGKMLTFAPVQRNERLERVSHFNLNGNR